MREGKRGYENEEPSLRAQSADCNTLEEAQNAARVKWRAIRTAGIVLS